MYVHHAHSSTHLGGGSALDARYVEVTLNIAARAACPTWPEVLAAAGWRAFARPGHEPVCRHIDFLLKREGSVFAFHQVERFDCEQSVALPREEAEALLGLLETAGLLAH